MKTREIMVAKWLFEKVHNLIWDKCVNDPIYRHRIQAAFDQADELLALLTEQQEPVGEVVEGKGATSLGPGYYTTELMIRELPRFRDLAKAGDHLYLAPPQDGEREAMEVLILRFREASELAWSAIESGTKSKRYVAANLLKPLIVEADAILASQEAES